MKALTEWITSLEDHDYYFELNEERKKEVLLANWWIYYSWKEAKYQAIKYLHNNRSSFSIESSHIDAMIEIYKQQTNILEKHFQIVPSPHLPKPASLDKKTRIKQADVLMQLLELEKEFNKKLEF